MKFVTLFTVVIMVKTNYDNLEPVIIRDRTQDNNSYAIYVDKEKADAHCKDMQERFPDETYKVVNSGLVNINT